MNDLKELAKKFYFEQVRVKKWRDNFLKELNKRTVIDKRELGFHCTYCDKFSKKPNAFVSGNRTIFPRNKNEIWIVNKHYDGCRGWN